MKKLFLTTGLMFAFVGLAQAKLATPILLKLDKEANLPLKKSAKFTWNKVKDATKYQIVFSNDENFENYDSEKNKCKEDSNKITCFTYLVASSSYQVSASNVMLQADGSYFWRVQAINKTERSQNSAIRSFSVGTPEPPVIEGISASPQQITPDDSSITLKAILDKSLPFGYSLKVSIEENGVKSYSGSLNKFSFNFKPTEYGESQFQILISEKDGTPIDPITLSDYSDNDQIKIGESDGVQIIVDSGKKFSFNFKPTLIGDSQFQISILDQDGNEIDSLSDSFSVVDNKSGKDEYTKIANDGTELPESAKLGADSKEWACTKDNKTGLIWEIKTSDGGLRDFDKTYTNYTQDFPRCGWTNCEYDYPSKFGDITNTDGFVKDVNKSGLCGKKDWRLPTKDELMSLVSCSDGKYDSDKYKSDNGECKNYNFILRPTINTTYFPDVIQKYRWFWTSSSYTKNSNDAWYVNSYYGYANSNYKSYENYVRLVRDEK